MHAEQTDPPARSFEALQLLTVIGSPIALGTALMLYFGWVRSQAQAIAFGTDVSVFEMSPQDLVLRSVDILFFPIILLLLVALLLLRLDPWMQSYARYVSPTLRHAWVVVLAGVLLLWLNYEIGKTLLPLWVLLAVVGMAYAGHLRRREAGEERSASPLHTALVVTLLIVTLFWVTERFAQVGGDALADDLKDNLAERLHPVALFSVGNLHLEANGVTRTRLRAPDGAYGYRYQGLYLLQHSGGKYFLLTDGWRSQEGGRLVVLSDNERIRLEFGDDVLDPQIGSER
jgi:hypothetical protein